MSASSLCVTCGTLSHERCRNGPDTFLIRGSAWVSTGPNLEKSCAGISGMPDALRRRRGRRRGLGRTLEEAEQVVLGDPALRPGRGDPGQVDAQLAGHPPHARPGMRAGAAPGWSASAAGHRGRCGQRRADGLGAPASRPPRPGAAPAAPPATGARCWRRRPSSACRIGVPSLTSSPTLTSTSPTVPARAPGRPASPCPTPT